MAGASWHKTLSALGTSQRMNATSGLILARWRCVGPESFGSKEQGGPKLDSLCFLPMLSAAVARLYQPVTMKRDYTGYKLAMA